MGRQPETNSGPAADRALRYRTGCYRGATQISPAPIRRRERAAIQRPAAAPASWIRLLAAGPGRRARFAEAVTFFRLRQIAPVERFVLPVLLAEREGDRRFSHFIAQIKRVRRIDVGRRLMRIGRAAEAGIQKPLEDHEWIAISDVEPGAN